MLKLVVRVLGRSNSQNSPASASPPHSEIGDLLKQATAKKRAGDLNAAIDLLRAAYVEIRKGQIFYGIEPFLRLPMYLQAGGRSDEAWRELNILLKDGVPSQFNDLAFLRFDHAAIYDKMRLFLQREKKPADAVKFGILSYFSRVLAFYQQSRFDPASERLKQMQKDAGLKEDDSYDYDWFKNMRKDGLENYTTEESVRGVVAELLKKARRPEQLRELVQIVRDHLKNLEKPNLGELGRQVDVFMR